jgi:hypothetical protein
MTSDGGVFDCTQRNTLKLHLDAATLADVGDGKIASLWTSSIGGLQAGGRAKFLVDGIKGKPAVEFSQTGDRFEIASDASLQPGSRNLALIAVVAPKFGNDPARVIAGSLTREWLGFALTGKTCRGESMCKNAFGMELNLAPNWMAQSAVVASESEHIVRGVRRGDLVEIVDNGSRFPSQMRPSSVASTLPSAPFSIGGSPISDVHDFTGRVSEVWLFVGEPNGDPAAPINESECVEKDLRAKYNL